MGQTAKISSSVPPDFSRSKMHNRTLKAVYRGGPRAGLGAGLGAGRRGWAAGLGAGRGDRGDGCPPGCGDGSPGSWVEGVPRGGDPGRCRKGDFWVDSAESRDSGELGLIPGNSRNPGKTAQMGLLSEEWAKPGSNLWFRSIYGVYDENGQDFEKGL